MKGKKGGKRKKKAIVGDVMLNVDKTFYELQITELNRKLARQRERVADLEETNAHLELKFGKLDEDRGDIISYLKRNLNERNSDITDLQTEVATLTQMNLIQKQNHEKQMEECEEKYESMREQLYSKVKLLTAQLNALEDYRMHREELLSKFETVQNELDAQEIKFKKMLLVAEKKAVLEKANLKQEMEVRMFNLSNRFQEANQIRIAATSQRVVRENIAMNNEMNYLINSTNLLDYENIAIRQQFKKVIADYQLLEAGHKKKLHEFTLQAGIIRELTEFNLNQKEIIDQYEVAIQKGFEDRRKLKIQLLNESKYLNRIKYIENSLNATRYAERELQSQLRAEQLFRHHLEVTINDVRLFIKSSLLEHPELFDKVKLPNNENLITIVINMLTYSKHDVVPPSPYSTVSSVSLVHKSSEIIPPTPQLVADKKPPIKKINVSTYLGASFQNFADQQDIESEPSQTTMAASTITSDYYIASSSEESEMSSSSVDEQTSSGHGADGIAEYLDAKNDTSTDYEYEEIGEEKLDEEYLEEEPKNT